MLNKSMSPGIQPGVEYNKAILFYKHHKKEKPKVLFKHCESLYALSMNCAIWGFKVQWLSAFRFVL